jgi:hypothetical protein
VLVHDAVTWFDDACHLVAWALLLGGLAVSLPRCRTRGRGWG